MTQYVINTGAFPNDGTGDPLRTAFDYVNLNFDQIFNAGPVLSNIEIINNSIITTNTNGNLILNPNGIGNIIGNAHVIPDTDSIRNLGAVEYRWDTVYARYYVGDGNGISNITAANISNGTARVDAYFNGNVAITANGVANVAVFTVDGLTVPGNILSGLFVGNVNTTNISGNSITISATGANQGIVLAPNGTGNVSVSFKNIVNLAEPVNPQDAATKYYVDTIAQGLDVKASCLLATQSPLPPYTYNNGVAGFGASITGNDVGALNIDGDLATANSRVLVKNESGANQPFNGIYIVTNPGDVGNAYVLTRSTDFDNGSPSGEIPGAFTFIEAGVTNADTGWVCTTNNPVTVGTTPITFTQFSGAGAYSAGAGLELVGGVFNALVDNNTTEINLSNQIAVKPGANLVTPNIGAATGTSLSLTGLLTANGITTSGEISTTANISGGNLLTGGQVSATADITGANLVTSGFVTATGQIVSSANINGANFNTAGKISATGNVTGNNLVASNSVVAVDVLASGTVSSVGNITGANLITTGAVLATTANITGNIASGNILNTGVFSSAGNVIGGNIRTAGQITATGNLTVGNVRTAGLVSVAGDIVSNSNIAGANIESAGIITAAGNIISNQYFIGNGAFLSGIDATGIQNGNSNVRVLANANVTISVAGTSNVAVFADTGVSIAGLVSASGNITSANVATGNLIATGNVSAENLNSNTLSGSNVAINSIGDLDLTSTGNITVGNTYITNLANPVNLQDAATKFYVDTVATGLDPKASVVYATASALGVPYVYNNGVDGVGATITANLPGDLIIDGDIAQVGQRVLVKNETGIFVSNSVPSAAFNGIYNVTVAGDVNTAFVLTRSTDFDLNTEMPSSFTFVEDGSNNADTGWVCTTNNPITVGFTPITFTQFSGAGTYTAGAGLSLSGSVFNAVVDNNTTEINGNNQIAVKASANLVTPNIGAATGSSLSVTGNISASTFIGNLIGNITGNIDAGGANTEIQFNDDNVLAGSAGFTFDKTANAVVVTGNVTANIINTETIAGNTVTITALVDGISLLSAGNITVGNTYINNLSDPIQPQDAATKIYVDSVAGGVTANVLGNLINMGSNTQGQLISNAVTLTTTTKVTDGIALLNQVLGKLVPPAPPAFPASQNITIASPSTYRMANIVQVDNTANSLTVAAGTTVTTVRRVATYSTNTITTAGPGDAGTVTTYRNGTAVGNVTLNPVATPSANGTYGGNLIISNNFDYNSANSNIAAGFWYVFSAGISGTGAPAGWNDIVIVDTSAGNTNVASWYYDNSAPGTPSYSATTMAAPGSATLLYSSTIPHYTNVNQFAIGTTVANVSGNLYPTSNVMVTGSAAGSFVAPASITYAQSNLGSNVIGPFATASFSTTANITTGFGGNSTGPSIAVNNSYSTGTLTLTTALGNTVLYKSGTAVAIDEGNIVVTSVGTGSGNAVRIISPGTGNTPAYTGNEANFNSQSSTLQTYDATVVGSGAQGVLKHDQTNYSSGYLPVGPDLSAGRTGTQYFTFKFVRTDVSKFDITYAGNVAGMWVSLPGSVIDSSSGANGWINMAVSYAGAGYPGVNAPGNGSDGCALGGTVSLNTTVASTSKTCTFGTVSSSSTVLNEIYIRIALTAGQSVTALSLKSASN